MILGLLLAVPAMSLDYSITFSIDLKKINMGIIRFEKTADTITSTVQLKPVLFIHFNSSITTKLGKNEYPTFETLRVFVNNRALKETMEYTPQKIIYREVVDKRSNVRIIQCKSSALSVNAFVNLFIKNTLMTSTTYPVFMVDRIVNFVYVPSNETKAGTFSTDNNYIIDVEFKKNGIQNVPHLIIIRKYLVYGIKWEIFKLSLLEFKAHQN